MGSVVVFIAENGWRGPTKQWSERKTSFIIIDAQSVKNTDTAESKGYDAGKKISGIKRHIAVDTQGLPHAIHITTANITDRKGALEACSLKKSFLSEVKNVLADGGYSGEPFSDGIQEILGCPVEIAKRNELHTFKVIPKDGLWNVLLAGLKSVEDYGKTVKKAKY